mmetsp:Transcript_47713/g.102246  ORF Transcript_47713/g.102246 Transcript_47713/m.102246 type:complete len:248 (-) Transcript_47713:161-904(-)
MFDAAKESGSTASAICTEAPPRSNTVAELLFGPRVSSNVFTATHSKMPSSTPLMTSTPASKKLYPPIMERTSSRRRSASLPGSMRNPAVARKANGVACCFDGGTTAAAASNNGPSNEAMHRWTDPGAPAQELTPGLVLRRTSASPFTSTRRPSRSKRKTCMRDPVLPASITTLKLEVVSSCQPARSMPLLCSEPPWGPRLRLPRKEGGSSIAIASMELSAVKAGQTSPRAVATDMPHTNSNDADHSN